MAVAVGQTASALVGSAHFPIGAAPPLTAGYALGYGFTGGDLVFSPALGAGGSGKGFRFTSEDDPSAYLKVSLDTGSFDVNVTTPGFDLQFAGGFTTHFGGLLDAQDTITAQKGALLKEFAGLALTAGFGSITGLTGGDVRLAPSSGAAASDKGFRFAAPNDLTKYLKIAVDTANFAINFESPYDVAFDSGAYYAGFLEAEDRIEAHSYIQSHEMVAPGAGLLNNVLGYCVDEAGVTTYRMRYLGNDVRIAKDLAAVAITQTFATADATHAARTAAALTDSIGGTVSTTLAAIPDPADTPLTADSLRDDLVATVLPAIRGALSSLADQVNKGRVDALDTSSLVNTIADAFQAFGGPLS